MSADKNIRSDIQALRAIAVVLVLLYHAKVPYLGSGFLGVDIFFVISGFLIASAIEKMQQDGTFCFGVFYWRRAFRLLPATYVVLLCVILVSPVVLTEQELRDLLWQVLGALSFTANIVLWSQAGYFGGEAALKPLLHTWSLSIEEQFYLLLPMLLVSLKGRHKQTLLLLLTFGSLLLLAALRENPSAAFYLLPTRAWELLIGVVLAVFIRRHGMINTPAPLYFGSYLVILVVAALPVGSPHPGFSAIVICIATAVILASRSRQLNLYGGRSVLYVGAISYSLYLIHWPVFSFFNNISFAAPWSTGIDSLRRLACILASLVMAALLHRFVEVRFRFESSLRAKVSLVLGAFIVALTASFLLADGRSQQGEIVAGSGRVKVCETQGDFDFARACRSTPKPRILLWGDSYAMHLVPGLTAGMSVNDPGIVQATRSACAPVLGVAQKRLAGGYNQVWAESCIRFNDSVLHAIRTASEIDTVVLSSPFSYLFDNAEGLYHRVNGGERIGWRSANLYLAVEALSQTITQIQAAGKKVVIVTPPPSGNYDMGRCGRRLVAGLPSLGVDPACRFPKNMVESASVRAAGLLDLVSQRNSVGVIDLSMASCFAETCESVLDGIVLYRDMGHLSVQGSIHLSETLNLRQAVLAKAR